MIAPHVLLVVPVLLAIVLYNTAFKDGKPTCDNFVLNTYLYAVFYLSLLGYFIAVLMSMNIKWNQVGLGIWILFFLVNIISYFAIVLISKKQVVLKHVLSFVYIASASIFLTILFELFFPGSIFLSIGLTFLLFMILSIIVWKYPAYFSSSISLPLFIVFFLIIIAEFIIQVFYPGSILEKAIILIVLLIVCYLLIVRTKRMIEQEKTCVQEDGPDYVRNGIGLVLIIENMISRILSLFGKRRYKRFL